MHIFKRHIIALLLASNCLGLATAGTEVKWKDVKDLQLGSALFNLYQDKNLTGIIELSAAQQLGKVKVQPDETELALAMLNLSYGLHRETAGTMVELLNKGNVNKDISNHIWFYIAKIRYQRGYFTMAESALSQITGALPWELEQQLKLFTALLLMDRQEYASAISILKQLRGKTTAVTFAHFNAGAGLLLQESNEEGFKIIEESANITPRNREEKALRDRANSRLGFISLLEKEDPEKAIEYFERVYLYGPESDEALLGLGWAHYRMENYDRALVAWSELAIRNKSNKNVQEAYVAVPYTLAKLEHYSEAAEKYNFALESFQNEMKEIKATITSVKKGAFFDKLLSNVKEGEKGWKGDVYDLPKTSESYYFTQMLAQHKYQEALKNYRDLRYLLEKLEMWELDLSTYDDINRYWVSNLRKKAAQFNDTQFQKRVSELRGLQKKYRAELEAVENSKDALSLATENEREHLSRILHLKAANEITASSNKNSETYRRQLNLLERRVLWDIHSQFSSRVRKLKLALEEITTEIQTAIDNKAQLQSLAKKSANNAESYDARIAAHQKRIKQLRPQIKEAIRNTEQYITEIAVQDLEIRSDMLAEFIAQVSFSVGVSYDRAK